MVRRHAPAVTLPQFGDLTAREREEMAQSLYNDATGRGPALLTADDLGFYDPIDLAAALIAYAYC